MEMLACGELDAGGKEVELTRRICLAACYRQAGCAHAGAGGAPNMTDRAKGP
jgi:hypothetical protein